MAKKLSQKRIELLQKLKSIRPAVIDPTMTTDMGIECSIATTEGIINREPGMFLFCGGLWPIRKISIQTGSGDNDYIDGFSLRISEEEDDRLYFTDIVPVLDLAFLELFEVDILWEDMKDSELKDWEEIISSESMNLVSICDLVD